MQHRQNVEGLQYYLVVLISLLFLSVSDTCGSLILPRNASISKENKVAI